MFLLNRPVDFYRFYATRPIRNLSDLLEKARLEEKGEDEGEPRTVHVFNGNIVASIGS